MNNLNKDIISKREKEILENISLGLTVNEIAKNLYLSPHTIITYRRNLLRKLQAKNAACLIRIAFEKRLLQVA